MAEATTEKAKIRVLIVEDSDVVRTLLEHIIGSDDRLEIAGSVATAEAALQALPSLRPDIISMDVNLPGMNGLEATYRIMSEHPTPIVIVSSSVSDTDARISLEALRAGALTVAEKPVGPGTHDFAMRARQITNKLALMSEVSVVRQRAGRYQPSRDMGVGPATASSGTSGTMDGEGAASFESASYLFLGVAASTGGPQALVRLFNDLGPSFPLPVLLIQHITAAFVDSFVSWLDGVVPPHVVVGQDRQIPEPGHIYVAPADCHLILSSAMDGSPMLRLEVSPFISSQRPSGTRLFQSMAQSFGRQTIGVLLTGMGDDGADGLLALRRAGGYTIAEHQSTAVVYGMPAAAVQRGAAIEATPLGKIGEHIWNRLKRADRESHDTSAG